MSLNMGISEEDQVVAMLARRFYVHHSEHRGKTPTSAPFAPEWAYDYARIAVTYCGYDDDTVSRLTSDYV